MPSISHTMKTMVSALALAISGLSGASAQPEIFEVGGHNAYLQAAPQPAEGNPWIWYAPTVKGNVIILKHKFYTDPFLKAGIAIASYDLGEVRGAPGSTGQFTLFYDAMVKCGYSAKPILLGQSRGGIMTLAWAVRHPDKVTAWAGIYPVCNLASYPLRSSKKETFADYGMDEPAIRAKLDELNPIANLAGLAKNKVPLFSVHGDKDGTVPFDENTKLLKERYEAAGGTCEVKVIPGRGHDLSPEFFQCQELVDFILKQAGKDGKIPDWDNEKPATDAGWPDWLPTSDSIRNCCLSSARWRRKTGATSCPGPCGTSVTS